MPVPKVPEQIQTQRLVITRWRSSDAPDLLPLLEAAGDYLRWIPERVSRPAPIPELELRLSGFGTAFDEDREYRYGIRHNGQLIGEIDLFPRIAEMRVPFSEADRVEIGYWITAEQQGKGFITEATRALIELARQLHGMTRVEIRCDTRNQLSAAIPQRLGFKLEPVDENKPNNMVWYLEIP